MIDQHSTTWQSVVKHAEATIESARKRLEMQSLGPTETEYERGRIKALRDLLALTQPQVQIPSTDPLYS